MPEAAKRVRELLDATFSVPPLNNIRPHIGVQYRIATDSDCHAQTPEDEERCAVTIQQKYQTSCGVAQDLVVILSDGQASWRATHRSVLTVDANLPSGKQAALLTNAIGVIAGLGDEFPYDVLTGMWANTSPPNCATAKGELPQAWKDALEKKVDGVGKFPGCGAYGKYGVRSTEKSVMFDPLHVPDFLHGFGAVNEALLREQASKGSTP